MARGYSATLEVKCWKEHTCCYCGAAYRYIMRKKKSGSGSSPQSAAANATGAAIRALRGESELRPCPGCGHCQPEMIGSRRLVRHGFLVLFVGSALLTLLLLGIYDLVPLSVALWLFILFAAAAMIAATAIGASNPNGNLRRNKVYAERLVAQQQMQITPAEPDREERPRPVIVETGVGFWLTFLLLGGTLVLMPGSELVRLAGRWPSNPNTHPAIVGPGDSFWIWIKPEEEIKSLRGYWTASGTAKIVGGLKLNPPLKEDEIPVTNLALNSTHWPDLTSSATETPVPAGLWARMTIPDKVDGLARKTVTIELKLNVKYPDSENGTVVEKEKADLKVPVEVHLAPYRAGFLYRFFWYVAVLGGGTMFLLAAGYHLLRDLALKQCGLPTKVIPIAEQDTGPPAAPKTEMPAKTEVPAKTEPAEVSRDAESAERSAQ